MVRTFETTISREFGGNGVLKTLYPTNVAHRMLLQLESTRYDMSGREIRLITAADDYQKEYIVHYKDGTRDTVTRDFQYVIRLGEESDGSAKHS